MTGSDQPAVVASELLAELRSRSSAENVAGMARFGIASEGTLGVSMPVVRALARDGKRQVGRDATARHELARLLWASGVHEARTTASLVDAPALVDDAQAEAWAADLDSWDVCDQLCMNLLRHTSLAWLKAVEWTARPEEYVKRAGFALGAHSQLDRSPPPTPITSRCWRPTSARRPTNATWSRRPSIGSCEASASATRR